MNNSLIKKQFFDSLKRGTGEAYLLMKNNPDIDFSEYIIKGAAKNYALDQQSEGSRANYIYRFIKTAKQKDKIVAAVLKKLQEEKGLRLGYDYYYYDLNQMCDLAVIFYKNGHPEALEALSNRVKKSDGNNYCVVGIKQIMEIGGIKGVLTAAEVLGKLIYQDKDFYEDSYEVDTFQKNNKTISVYAELKKAAKHNKYINAYLSSISKNNWSLPDGKSIKPVKFTYEYLKERIDKGNIRVFASARTNDLSEVEIKKLADDFLLEKDPRRQEIYLRLFTARKFPYDYKPIFEIAKGRNPENTRLVEFAFHALQHFKSNELRQYALSKLKTTRHIDDYLYLLVSTYKKVDHKLLTELTKRSDNYDYIHSLVFPYIAIYEKNHTKKCKEPLEAIYNKMNCGIHRGSIVRILNKQGVLSDKIRLELKYDSRVKKGDY